MMHLMEIAGRRYAQFDRLRHVSGLVHAFCTRPADVSARQDDRQEERADRRRQMAVDLGLDPARLRYCEQVHATNIAIVDSELRPPGDNGMLASSDGVITATPGVPVMSFSADCPLILVFDPQRRVLGLVHASWRCTVAVMARRLVELMISRFGCRPPELLAGIGPGAGPCCYEVRQDVLDAAASLPGRDDCFERRAGRWYFDLWRANRVQLCTAGLPDENVLTAGVCTLCRNDLYYSFRREGAGCGHFGLMAALQT